jgi:hypothetical protein
MDLTLGTICLWVVNKAGFLAYFQLCLEHSTSQVQSSDGQSMLQFLGMNVCISNGITLELTVLQGGTGNSSHDPR